MDKASPGKPTVRRVLLATDFSEPSQAAFRACLELCAVLRANLTHEELANMIGSSRETVTRMLTRFKKDELIQVRGSSIYILAPDLLEQLSA